MLAVTLRVDDAAMLFIRYCYFALAVADTLDAADGVTPRYASQPAMIR